MPGTTLWPWWLAKAYDDSTEPAAMPAEAETRNERLLSMNEPPLQRCGRSHPGRRSGRRSTRHRLWGRQGTGPPRQGRLPPAARPRRKRAHTMQILPAMLGLTVLFAANVYAQDAVGWRDAHGTDRDTFHFSGRSPANSASHWRSSVSLGGLLITIDTPGGISPEATSRWPQPVSMMTAVPGAAALMAAATERPSTCGMPRSVMTTGNALPAFFASRKASIPALPPLAVCTWWPS